MKQSLYKHFTLCIPGLFCLILTIGLVGCDGFVDCCSHYYQTDSEMLKICQSDGLFTQVPTGAYSDDTVCSSENVKSRTEQLAKDLNACCGSFYNENDKLIDHLGYSPEIYDYDAVMQTGRYAWADAIHSIGEFCVRNVMNNITCDIDSFSQTYENVLNVCSADVAEIADENLRSESYQGCLNTKFNDFEPACASFSFKVPVSCPK